jgi:hypothetical protein
MKLLFALLFTVGFLGGCLVEERRDCGRGARWDGHHCMAEHDRGHDHDDDHDRGHDGDHDRGHDHDGDHDNGHGHGHGHDHD